MVLTDRRTGPCARYLNDPPPPLRMTDTGWKISRSSDLRPRRRLISLRETQPRPVKTEFSAICKRARIPGGRGNELAFDADSCE
jgi:hypothetical protein